MQNCPSCGCENEADSVFCEDCGAQLALPQSSAVAVAVREVPLKAGEVAAGRFRIDEVLETGPIHRYRATDESTEEPVLLLESSSAEGKSVVRQQAELLRALQGETIWRPTDLVSGDDFDWLVGPVPGPERLLDIAETRGTLPPEQVRVLAEDLGAAVARFHEQGLLIRSLRPTRIWLTEEGRAVLEGFGRCVCAQQPDNDYAVTPGFSPPEAYGMQGGVVDARSDIFSLGAVLHFALTARSPDLESRETFFSFPRPDIPDAETLLDVVMTAVAKSPDARYQSAAEFLDALKGGSQPAAQEARKLEPETGPAQPGSPSAPLRYQVAMKSDIGVVRSINQDACLELRLRSVEKSVPHDVHLIVVIDGMGGEAEGDKAASLALRALAQEVVSTVLTLQDGRATSPLLPPDVVGRNRYVLRRALETANRVIHDYAEQESSRRGMGCTITACMLESDRAVFGHVGDTRAMLIRSEIDQITTDHSLVGRLVQMGQMTWEEARTSPQRSIIYRAMGTNKEVEIDLYDRQLQPGDYLMMSSDGVWEYFQQDELLQVFMELSEPPEICDRLVKICLDRGADDNATVAVIRAL